jgi:hypothetical protein
VVVDQSGSMLESAIFSAVMASIFAELPAVKTSLVLFDTESRRPVRPGRPAGRRAALDPARRRDRHHEGLDVRRHPGPPAARTIVVLITDFYEGRDESDLVAQTRRWPIRGFA